MSSSCLRCGQSIDSWLHGCQSTNLVFDPEPYLQFRGELATGNPLDRLTVADVVRIEGNDPDQMARDAEAMLEAYHQSYFSSPLIYRVELHILSETGFQAVIDYVSVKCDGPSEAEFSKAVDLVTSGRLDFPPLKLDSEKVYLCRLVSFNDEGTKYVWHTKRLEHGTEWSSSDWR